MKPTDYRANPRRPLDSQSAGLSSWVRANRTLIDAIIRQRCPNLRASWSDDERRLWVLNDEPLYLEARRQGVNV